METNKQPKIAIAEQSLIIRLGVIQSIRRYISAKAQLIEISNLDSLYDSLRVYTPDILIVSPTHIGQFEISKLKEYSGNKTKLIALLYNVISPETLKNYDETITIYDEGDKIKEKIEKLLKIAVKAVEPEETLQLSGREKEIVVCIVKGLSNKEIAEELSISTHTVITHRKNITRKLQIHSPAALTIYAIVNKLVSLDEVKIS
ncbi:MAG: response regulator transcription factor [Bacteroidales bacterium]